MFSYKEDGFYFIDFILVCYIFKAQIACRTNKANLVVALFL